MLGRHRCRSTLEFSLMFQPQGPTLGSDPRVPPQRLTLWSHLRVPHYGPTLRSHPKVSPQDSTSLGSPLGSHRREGPAIGRVPPQCLTLRCWVPLFWYALSDKFRSSRPEVLCKKGAYRNFVKFTVKYLCQNFLLNKVARLRLSYRCFPVNFVKFLKHLLSQNTCGGCLCKFTKGR